MSHDWSYEAERILKEKFPLHFCCREGNSDDMQKLIMMYDHEKLFEEDNFYYWSPAHWAAYFGKLDCLIMITQKGRFDLPSQRSFQTPLHLASYRNELKSVKWLLHLGAKIDYQLNCLRILMQIPGYSASMYTTNFRQTPLHVAAFGGQTHCLNWLFQGENDPLRIVNQQDYMGETPLHKAARTGSMECVQLLLSQGADASVQSFNLRTAADIAALSGYVHCATVIRQVSHFSNNSNHAAAPPLASSIIQQVNQIGVTPNGDAMMEIMDTDLTTNHHSIQDVTIDPDISSNRKPVGGRKRSRVGLCDEGCKRQRMDGKKGPQPNMTRLADTRL